MEQSEIIKKYKQYLTKAQIKSLAEQAERYKQLHAGNRASAMSSLQNQYRTARRGLQNAGLASRRGNIISGSEQTYRDALDASYADYNASLRKNENAMLERRAVAEANQTIAARKRAAEEAAKKAEEAAKKYEAQQQAISGYNHFKQDIGIGQADKQQGKTVSDLIQSSFDHGLSTYDPYTHNDSENLAYYKMVAKKNGLIGREANTYAVKQTAEAANVRASRKSRFKGRLIGMTETIMDTAREHQSEMRLQQEYRVNLAQIGKEDPTLAAELKNTVENAYKDYDAAMEDLRLATTKLIPSGDRKKHGVGLRMQRDSYQQAAAARSELAKVVNAAKAPADQRQYYLMSDEEFDTVYDAAERALKRAELDYKIAKQDDSSNMDDMVSDSKGTLKKATQMLTMLDQIKMNRISNSQISMLAVEMPIPQTAKNKDKQYDSTKHFVDENQAGQIAVSGKKGNQTFTGRETNPSQNWKSIDSIGWTAEDYAQTHDTNGSKWDALVNEWSLINGRTAALFGPGQIENLDPDFIGGALDFIQMLFGANRANTDLYYQRFRNNCINALTGNYETDGTEAQQEQMDAMLTLANLMTDEERARFNALRDTVGGKEADEYFMMLYQNVLPNRFIAYVSDYNADYMNELPGIVKAAFSVESVIPSLTQGIPGVYNAYSSNQQDPNAATVSAMGYNQAQNIRNARMQNFGEFGQFAYGAAMSMWDSYWTAQISGGIGKALQGVGVGAELSGKIGSALGGSLLGASAYNSAYQEGLERGLTPEKARMTALGSGINEMLFETLSLDMLVGHFQKGGILKVSKNGFVNWVVNTLVQGGVEGSEEVFTDIGNNLWDKMVNGIYSEELTNIREYVSQGMSLEEAKRKVSGEFAAQLGMSFAGGFASGGVMGGGSTFMGMVQNRGNEKVGKGLRQNSRVMNELRNFDFKSEYAKEILQQKNLTNADIADLFNIMQQELLGQYKSDIQKAVADGKITQEQADLLKQYEQNGVQIVKDGKVVDNAEGITVEQMQSVQDAIANLDNAARIQFLNNEEMRSLVQAVGGESAAIIDQSETVEREAEKAYRQTIAEIDADETLTDAQKKQKTAEARQTRADARSAAASELDRTWEKHGKGVLKAETDDSGVHYVRTGKGSGKVTFDFSTYNDGKSENHNTVETMTKREKAALRIAQVVASRGVNVKVESEFTGEHRNENGYYDRKTQTIHVNLSGTNSVLWTVSHELTHHLANVNKQAYNDLRDAIRAELQKSELTTSELEQQGFDYQVADVDEYIVKTGNLWDALVQYEAEKRGYGEEAEEEVIARCCESFLANDVFIQSFAKKHFKSAKAISSFLTQMDADMNQIFTDAEIRLKMNGIRTDVSPEQQILSQVANVQEIAQKWARAVNALEKKRAAKSDGVRASTMDVDTFTKEDVDVLHAMPTKSINDFTDAEIKSTEKWARKFYKELGTKSPYFRAWFGEWRAHDISSITFSTKAERKPFKAGKAINKDTGKVISWGDQVKSETIGKYGKGSNAALALDNIEGIVKNATLFDTQVSNEKKKSKMPGSAYVHIFYAVVENKEGSGSLIRFTAEEAVGVKDGKSFTRAYELNEIKEVAELQGVFSPQGEGLTRAAATSIKNVADLYGIVKKYDKRFVSAKSVDQSVLNEDGTPKVFYHGTDAQFEAFDASKGRSTMDIQGMFFSPWEIEARGYGPNVGQYYVSLSNPASEDVGYAALRRFKGQNEAGMKARQYLIDQGYDGVVNYDEIIAFYPTQIKSATDNIGTFNRYNDRYKASKMDDAKAGSLSGQEYLKYLQLGKKVVNKAATAEEIREFKKKMNSLSQDNREAFLDRLREKRIRDDEGSKVREQRLKRDLRITALKWNQRLVKMLANPTEASHIPVQLAQEVAEFTKALTEYMDGGTERGRLNLDKIKIAYERSFADEKTIEQAQAEDPNYNPRGLIVLDGKTKKESTQYNEQLAQMIEDLNVVLQSKSIEELNSFELNELLNIVRGVTYTVYEANRMIGTSERKAIWQVGDKMVSELETAPKVSQKLRGYLEKSLDLRRLAKIFSGSNENAEFVKLVDQLNEGAIEKERVAQSLQSIFTPVTDRYGDEIRKWYGKNAEWIDTGIKKGDKKIEITKGMRVSLALHVLNAGNMRHIQRGGLTIPNRELYRKGKMQDAYANGELVRLKAEQINEIISHMTEAEKAYVEAAKNLFHKRTGYYVNRTSLKLLGYRKAIVENYFPIHTNKNFTKTDFASLKMDGSIEGQGFLKERAGSSNPVYLEDITSVVNRQIRGVALYAGLAIPMRNFNAVMNASIYEDDNGVWSPKTTVKEALIKKMGAYGAKVVEGFLADVSEMSHIDVSPIERFAGKLATNYVKAVLLGNLKVAMKQVASYPTAAAVIPWKYLGKALFKGGRNHRLISRADVDLINQYTPLYQMRREGQANEIASIMAKRGLEQNLPWLLGWITKMDVMTVGRLWSAAEYMVADQQKNLTVGSDAYFKAVAKVFNDTVQQTQPNFTPLQRNAVLRSKNPIERSLVLFGTQRMQNGGILIEAVYELKHSKGKSEAEIRAAKQKLGRAVASQIVQNILLIVASIGVDALRGRMKGWQDDDKEITVESLAKGMGDMFLSNFIGSFLFGSEVYDLISTVYKKATDSPAYGANFTIPAIDALVYLYDTVGDLAEFFNYVNEGHTVEEKLKKAKSLSYDLAKAFGYATGIPLENAVKDLFKGIIPAIKDHVDYFKTGEFPQWWLHQSGKLDNDKTAANYKEWTNAGKKGSVYFYWEKKLKDAESTDDESLRQVRANELHADKSLTNEEKAMLLRMVTSGATSDGAVVYGENGKIIVDFTNDWRYKASFLTKRDSIAEALWRDTTATPEEKAKLLSLMADGNFDVDGAVVYTMSKNEDGELERNEVAVDFTNLDRYRASTRLSEAQYQGFLNALEQGVPEDYASTAFIQYSVQKKQGEGANDRWHDWLFKIVSDPHQRAILDMCVVGNAASVVGAISYKEDGKVYADYSSKNLFDSYTKGKKADKADTVYGSDMSVDDKAKTFASMYDGYTADGGIVYDKNGKVQADFTSEESYRACQLGESSYNSYKKAVGYGASEKDALDAITAYAEIKKENESDGEDDGSTGDLFREWLFGKYSDPTQRARMDAAISDKDLTVKDGKTYSEGKVYRDYKSQAWYTMSTKPKQYEYAQRLVGTGLSDERAIKLITDFKDIKKDDSEPHLKGLTDAQKKLIYEYKGWKWK